MAHKKHQAPIPPANKPRAGPAASPDKGQKVSGHEGAPFNEQDPKRRLGDFQTAGEHARQQPSNLNDGNQHSK